MLNKLTVKELKQQIRGYKKETNYGAMKKPELIALLERLQKSGVKKKEKAIPLDMPLYNKVKTLADEIYKKPSAFKSGFIVKKYKELGGKYEETNTEKPLKRWFKEKWMDVNPNPTDDSYPVFRPTVKVNSKTPKTKDEIPLARLEEQAQLKQVIKGTKNLPKF